MKTGDYLIYKLSDQMKKCTKIDAELFRKLDVKRGLRNEDGTGVLVGLTNIGNVVGYDRLPDGTLKPKENYSSGVMRFQTLSAPSSTRNVSASRRSPICFFPETFRTRRKSPNSTGFWSRTCLLRRTPFCTSSNSKAGTS